MYIHSDGPVTVRNMKETPEDCSFAGRLAIEAFRSKFVHVTSERSIPTVIKCSEKSQYRQDPVFYQRNFIAEYNGEKAGLMMLKYNGDPEERDNDAWNALGCCDTLGLCCLGICLSSSVSKGKCYLDHICVDERFRGKGIGKVLMTVGENEARRNGCRSIYLYVSSTNRAKNLYERQGYRVKGEESCCCFIYCCTGEKVCFI
ncbi:hypothetical protein FSP39_004049 [Pinctada imbricata]|uniref:N-acetyltransferase domain-containing protein n=1 Tax=Pinctada imbricata TaxID=66713 RepID=A0AA88YBW6_PINIB|nr:hypothetical protein FSP39_004049 [Pinctada imbricata]